MAETQALQRPLMSTMLPTSACKEAPACRLIYTYIYIYIYECIIF